MENFDLISTGVNFFYKGNKKCKSDLGGMLSILFYLSFVICSLFYFIDFFQQNKWSSVNKITTTDSSGWDPFEIQVLHKSLKTEEGLHDLYYQINEVKTIFFNKNMTCTKEQMKEMEMEPNPDYNFFCFKVDQFLPYSIKKRCYHSKAKAMKKNCFSNERNITVRFLSSFLDSEKMSQPVKKFHDAKEVYGRKNQIFVTYNKLIDSTNYFFEDEKLSYFSEVWFQEDMDSMWDQGTYTISPLVDIIPLQKLIIERRTAKFNDILAKVLSIIQLIFLFLGGFHKYIYSEYSFNTKQLDWWLKNENDLPDIGLPLNEIKSMNSKISKDDKIIF
jgi:hypothetical protein